MTTANYKYNKKDGGTILCYGDIEWDSNFSVVCDNEEYDGIAADIDVEIHNTWKRVCDYLVTTYRNDIEQIETC
jgi:hypothetical protein